MQDKEGWTEAGKSITKILNNQKTMLEVIGDGNDIEKIDENHEVLSDEWCLGRDRIIYNAVLEIKAAIINTIEPMEEKAKAEGKTLEMMKIIKKWQGYYDGANNVQNYSPFD